MHEENQGSDDNIDAGGAAPAGSTGTPAAGSGMLPPRPRVVREPTIAAVDDGYGMIKVVTKDGKWKIPSRARVGAHGVATIGVKTANQAPDAASLDNGYETEGTPYTVSADVEGEGTRFNDYPVSGLNRVLVQHGLRLAGLSGKQVKIVTGLPVNDYFSGDTRNVDKINRKIESLMKPVRALDPTGKVATVVENHVCAEGVAAWIDRVLDNKGRQLVNFAQPAAVVDIGGRTTDCVLVLPGFKVDFARSGTGDIGVLRLYDSVKRRVHARHKVEMPVVALEQAVITGQIMLWGKTHDVSDLVKEAKREVSEMILREVQRRIGDTYDLHEVLIVGGGAVLFDNIRQAFPNANVPEDPEFANARGMLKYLMYVA